MPKIRKQIDKIGFASVAGQMDAFYHRLLETQSEKLQNCRTKAGMDENTKFRLAICPHDDYTYVGYHYPLALEPIKAQTIFIFGVAHKAAQFNLSDKIIFEDFDSWQSAYGKIKISPLREKLISKLPKETYLIHNDMQQVEHSIESMLPFLQRQNREIEIIPILIPASTLKDINDWAKLLANAIAEITNATNLKWGTDFTLLTTSDAVHYGDKDWGNSPFSPLGVGNEANEKVLEKEQELIDSCFSGFLTEKKAFNFYHSTVSPEDYQKYQWTWCGRYVVSTATLTAFYLAEILTEKPLEIKPLSYSSSITNNYIPVNDLPPMGITAPANEKHWVGHCSVGFL